LNQEHLAGKGLQAISSLLYKCKTYNLEPGNNCQLFDAYVGSILGYASEIWSFTKSKD
jgi:hypothetical protein